MTDLELIQEILEKPIAFHKVFFDVTKDIKIALFLSQLFYWHKKMKSEWFYKTRESWEEETGLNRYEQEHAKKKLTSLKLLETKMMGAPPKQYFKFDFERLIALAKQYYSQSAVNPPINRRESRRLIGCKPADLSAVNPPNIYRTENTTENTTEKKKSTSKEVLEESLKLSSSPQKKSIEPKKETDKQWLARVESFELTPELLAWGEKQDISREDMKAHYDFYIDYLANIDASKRKKDLAAQFRNCVRANWANVKKQAKSWQQQNNEATEKAKENFLKMVEGGHNGSAKIDYFS